MATTRRWSLSWTSFPTTLRRWLRKPLCWNETVLHPSLKSTSSSKNKARRAKSAPLSTTAMMKQCRLNSGNSFYFNVFRYVEAKADRVTVIFSTVFKDPDDIVIGKLFLQASIYKNSKIYLQFLGISRRPQSQPNCSASHLLCRRTAART